MSAYELRKSIRRANRFTCKFDQSKYLWNKCHHPSSWHFTIEIQAIIKYILWTEPDARSSITLSPHVSHTLVSLEIKHFKTFFGLKSIDDLHAPSLRTKEMKAATELFLSQNVDIRGLSSAVHRNPTYIFSCSGDDGNESYASDIASDGRNMNRPNVNAWGMRRSWARRCARRRSKWNRICLNSRLPFIPMKDLPFVIG
jgi:hypothetical protein